MPQQVQAELRKRGLSPVIDNDGRGFESFHVKDPDGLDIQIANGNGLAKDRQTSPSARTSTKLVEASPFESTGWKTVWMDHPLITRCH